jgi:hypothetical protein
MSPPLCALSVALLRKAVLVLGCLVIGLFLGAGAALAGFTETKRTVDARLLVVNRADVNLDSVVDGTDLRLVARNIGVPVFDADPWQAFGLGDVNLDGYVDVVDLATVAFNSER